MHCWNINKSHREILFWSPSRHLFFRYNSLWIPQTLFIVYSTVDNWLLQPQLTSGVEWYLPSPTIEGGEHYVFRSSVRQLTFIAWPDISGLSAEISMTLGINIYHISEHCWKDFQGQRAKVKVRARQNALFRQRDGHRASVVASRMTCYDCVCGVINLTYNS